MSTDLQTADQPEASPSFEKAAAEAVARLQAGEALPEEFRYSLFSSKREYELTYAGKQRRSDVLANTMGVPLQASKSFGANAAGWHNQLIFGNNLQVLKTLQGMKEAGQLKNTDGTDGVRLCYIDPPFATRRDFSGAKQERAYQDKVEGAEFIEALRQRIIFIHEILAENGSLYVHLDQKKGHYIKVILDEVFGEHNFINEVIWDKGFRGTESKSRYQSAHDTLFFYAKNARHYVWNGGHQPYKDKSMSRYNQVDEEGRAYALIKRKRTSGEEYYGKTYPKAEGKSINDVISHIATMASTNEERIDYNYPTQKPPALLELLIAISSNPGDLVLDAYAGSGTTAAAAERLGRRWIAIDSGKLAIYVSQKRLLQMPTEHPGTASIAPFDVVNAGLYDIKELKSLPWLQFRRFALELFECREREHKVGGVTLDGFRGVDHVLVFNFQKHPDAVMGRSYVEDLHQAIGSRIGRQVFIIAPQSSVAIREDYIDLTSEGRSVRYYILRIPYSIIEELHQRGFSRLQQPTSLAEINQTVDSVGFDFIYPPSVKCGYGRSANQMVVKMTAFESHAIDRGDKEAGFDTLAMVMIDTNYDGNVFHVEKVFFAEKLRASGFRLEFPLSEAGPQMMFVYVDIYGNEAQEVRSRKDFGSKGQAS